METLQVDQPHEGVTRITLNRPERLNAMNSVRIGELHGALADIAVDPACRIVVLTGAERICARDQGSAAGQAPGSQELDRVGATFATQTHIATLVPQLRSLPQPVIAAVNGPAAGGGLALALASDVRIAASGARFNVAFVRVGLSGCDIGVSWLLPRLIGTSRAWELMLHGRVVEAEEADRVGLVLRVVPDDELQSAALETAALIAANAPWGVRMTKEVMWSQLEVGSLQAGIDLENRTQVLSSMTGASARPWLRSWRSGRLTTANRHGPRCSRCCDGVQAAANAGTAGRMTTLDTSCSIPGGTLAARRLPWWSGESMLTLLLASCIRRVRGRWPGRGPRIRWRPSPTTSTPAPLSAPTRRPCLRITLDALDAARGRGPATDGATVRLSELTIPNSSSSPSFIGPRRPGAGTVHRADASP